MNAKGQLSIEMILLLAVVMWFISSLVIPGAQISIDAATDVAGIAQVTAAIAKLENTVDSVALNKTDGWKDVYIYLPHDSNIACYRNVSDPANPYSEIRFQAPISRSAPECEIDDDGDDLVCTKRFRINDRVAVDCDGFGDALDLGDDYESAGIVYASSGHGRYVWVRVSKVAGVVYLDEQ